MSSIAQLADAVNREFPGYAWILAKGRMAEEEKLYALSFWKEGPGGKAQLDDEPVVVEHDDPAECLKLALGRLKGEGETYEEALARYRRAAAAHDEAETNGDLYGQEYWLAIAENLLARWPQLAKEMP